MQIDLRNICFVRHAKSSWEDPGLEDRHRPLSKRGERDAPYMANKMMELQIQPELIITSPAVRARTTARIFADAANLEPRHFVVNDLLYGADVAQIVELIQSIDDGINSIFVFGHNPTMTIMANCFAGVDIDNVPTCGVLQAKTMVSSWKDWSPEVSAFVGFYYPKQYAI
jgi:phosphohistidine phosphatase